MLRWPKLTGAALARRLRMMSAVRRVDIGGRGAARWRAGPGPTGRDKELDPRQRFEQACVAPVTAREPSNSLAGSG